MAASELQKCQQVGQLIIGVALLGTNLRTFYIAYSVMEVHLQYSTSLIKQTAIDPDSLSKKSPSESLLI